MMRWRDALTVVVVLGIVGGVAIARRRPSAPETAISTGRPRMVHLGAGRCVACRQMAPILVERRSHYSGRADVVFIDVWENPEQADRYTYRAIPTQIFYDRDGRETWRHEGFLGHAEIASQFQRLGVD